MHSHRKVQKSIKCKNEEIIFLLQKNFRVMSHTLSSLSPSLELMLRFPVCDLVSVATTH